MRYIKIAVPDDFDEEGINGDKLSLVNYTKDGSQAATNVAIWKPPYSYVLNHGYIGLVDFMGDDMNVVNAARVSYGRGTKKVNTDRGLIRYLMRHRHCYRGDMEVLTIEGWKTWKQCYDEGKQTFLVPNPETRSYSVETLPVKAFDYNGDMHEFSNERMSYSVTPEHKMLFKGKYRDKFGIFQAKDMPKWGWFDPMLGYSTDEYEGVVDDLFLFIGFFLGDGHYASTNRISFGLKKERKIQFLNDLLTRLGWDYSIKVSDDGISRFYIEFSEEIYQWLDLQNQTNNKHFDFSNLTDLSGSELRGLLRGLLESDGSNKKDRNQVSFSSSSRNLTDLVSAISPRMGLDAHYCRKDQYGSTVNIYFPKGRTSLESRRQYHGVSEYSGCVFCATTSTGFLMVRGANDKYGFVSSNSTPFEMVEFMFHVKAPIFVFRQWHRHRTASINEYSGRYSILEDNFYLPELPDTAIQSTTNRQGREAAGVSEDEYLAIVAAMEQVFNDSYQSYMYMLGDGASPPDTINNRKLWVEESAMRAADEARRRMFEDGVESAETWTNEKAEAFIEEKMKEYYAANELAILDKDFPGLARELARIVLPLATYSQMYWKANLKNIMHFIGLRSDPHAQKEIRIYSDAMLELIKPHVPWVVEAFLDYQFEGSGFSRVELEAIAHLVELVQESNPEVDDDYWNGFLREKGASVREVREFVDKLLKGTRPRHFPNETEEGN